MNSDTNAAATARRRFAPNTFFGVVILCCAAPLSGAATLDQEYNPPSYALEAHNGPLYRAQTFTVGITGQLTRFDVYVGGIGNSVFEIWDATGGVPDPVPGTPLASVAVPITTGSTLSRQFVPVDITAANLQVVAGDRLAIVHVGDPLSSGASWFGNTVGDYAGGAAYTTSFSGLPNVWNSTTWDLGFRTYVGPIPEPTSLTILALMLGATVVFRRLR